MLPRLVQGSPSEQDIEGVLLDIGEELRHALYHIKASRFYSYLQ
ncbi:MAG: hypothetical protein AB1486_12300 [Planctomycetota bacterium]